MKSREWLFGFFSSLVAVPAIAQPASDLLTILTLKEANHVITVKSDGHTLFYTIVGEGVSREDLKLDEIKAWKPDLYERLKTTVANPKIDASNQYDEKKRSL